GLQESLPSTDDCLRCSSNKIFRRRGRPVTTASRNLIERRRLRLRFVELAQMALLFVVDDLQIR
ncbi:MAG TPA: hypothetical protein VE863_08635, partial [Pyrinomonadaceae bacterium]|nr:hypothetical protein [Pyrinomonadaceae bacterium]